MADVTDAKSGKGKEQDITDLQTRFQEVRYAEGASIGCQCRSNREQDAQGNCIFCRLDKHYLGPTNYPEVCNNDLILPPTQAKLYHKDVPLISSGIVDVSKSPSVCCGW